MHRSTCNHACRISCALSRGACRRCLKFSYLDMSCFPPLGYGLTKINDNLEESVHERNSVSKNAAAVQEHRLWGPVEGVGIQDGLDHDEGLGEILPGTVVPIIQ